MGVVFDVADHEVGEVAELVGEDVEEAVCAGVRLGAWVERWS